MRTLACVIDFHCAVLIYSLLTIFELHDLPCRFLVALVKLQFLQLVLLLVFVDLAALHLEVVIDHTGQRGLQLGVCLLRNVELEFLPGLAHVVKALLLVLSVDPLGFVPVEAPNRVELVDGKHVVLLLKRQAKPHLVSVLIRKAHLVGVHLEGWRDVNHIAYLDVFLHLFFNGGLEGQLFQFNLIQEILDRTLGGFPIGLVVKYVLLLEGHVFAFNVSVFELKVFLPLLGAVVILF
mmetsp:Transcript_74526/g.161200  ORF Transcript_74526/g.161200 Transcript_74526/m.161200 type:complete len:236 (-) Transcript_74526:1188-1895(-)